MLVGYNQFQGDTRSDALLEHCKIHVAADVESRDQLLRYICFYGGESVDDLHLEECTHIVATTTTEVCIYAQVIVAVKKNVTGICPRLS